MNGSPGPLPPRPQAGTVHPDEELSALLDEELSTAETESVLAHLAGCEGCRVELDALAATRLSLRASAWIDPPEGFLERAIDAALEIPERRQRRWGVANLAASAAVWVAIIGFSQFSGATGVVSPQLGSLVSNHQSSASLFGSFLSIGTTSTSAEPERLVVPVLPVDGLPGPFRVPERIGADLVLVQAEVDDHVLSALYSNGVSTVSVFQQRGRLDWDALPEGERVDIGGATAWRGRVDGAEVVVVERDDVVFTVVGPSPDGRVVDIAHDVPDPAAPSLFDRVRSAGKGLLEAFSLGG